MKTRSASILEATAHTEPPIDRAAAGSTLRIRTPLAAFGPMVVGIGITVLARLLWDMPAFERLRDLQQASAGMALIWILPPALGGLISCTRTLWLDITPGGLSARRMLGTSRNYEAAEVIGWGFEYGRNAYSSLPPANAKKKVRFVIRMADGFAFAARVNGKMADRLAKTLIARCSPM